MHNLNHFLNNEDELTFQKAFAKYFAFPQKKISCYYIIVTVDKSVNKLAHEVFFPTITISGKQAYVFRLIL